MHLNVYLKYFSILDFFADEVFENHNFNNIARLIARLNIIIAMIALMYNHQTVRFYIATPANTITANMFNNHIVVNNFNLARLQVLATNNMYGFNTNIPPMIINRQL